MERKILTFAIEMVNNQLTYPKKLLKWLLAVTLFFNFFAFSGYFGNSSKGTQQATQTEQVFSKNYKSSKRTVSYKKAVELSNLYITEKNSNKYWANAILAYNTSTKVKSNFIKRQLCSIIPAKRFLQIKTFPQSSNEDNVSAIIG